MPNHGLGLHCGAEVGQAEFNGNWIAGVKFPCQNQRQPAFAKIERTSGNAVGDARAQHRNVNRYGNWEPRTAAGNKLFACQLRGRAHA